MRLRADIALKRATNQYGKEMKKLMATLFILGIPWLFLVVPAILSPIGIFMPEYDYQMHDVLFSISVSVSGLLGVAIWLGYRLRWKLDSFVWLTKRQFWSLSFIHHAAWIFLIPWGYHPYSDIPYRESLVDFWFRSAPNMYGIWIALNLLLSIFALFYDRETHQDQHAEQIGA